jgi:hypothetical protein
MSVRSGFEFDVWRWLQEAEVEFEYEEESFQLWLPVQRGHKCVKCEGKKIVKSSLYTPDFFLSNGIVLETKGRFTALDRKKALAMKEQWPEIDYRLVFQRDNKLSKSSKTRYSAWAEDNEIPWHIGRRIPAAWMK